MKQEKHQDRCIEWEKTKPFVQKIFSINWLHICPWAEMRILQSHVLFPDLSWYYSIVLWVIWESKLAWHQLTSTSVPKSEELLLGGTFLEWAIYPEVSSSLYLAKVFVKLASNPAIFWQNHCSTAAVPAPPLSWAMQQLLHTDEEKPEPSSGALNRSVTSDMFIFFMCNELHISSHIQSIQFAHHKSHQHSWQLSPCLIWWEGL